MTQVPTLELRIEATSPITQETRTVDVVGHWKVERTIEEALDNLKEATELYLEEFPLRESTHPILTTFEVAEIVNA